MFQIRGDLWAKQLHFFSRHTHTITPVLMCCVVVCLSVCKNDGVSGKEWCVNQPAAGGSFYAILIPNCRVLMSSCKSHESSDEERRKGHPAEMFLAPLVSWSIVFFCNACEISEYKREHFCGFYLITTRKVCLCPFQVTPGFGVRVAYEAGMCGDVRFCLSLAKSCAWVDTRMHLLYIRRFMKTVFVRIIISRWT